MNIGLLVVLSFLSSAGYAQAQTILDEFSEDSAKAVDVADAMDTATTVVGSSPILASSSLRDGHSQDLLRDIFVNSRRDFPASAAIVDSVAGWATLLSSESASAHPALLPVVSLFYRYSSGGAFDLGSFSHIRIRYATTTQHKVNATLFHDSVDPGSRWRGSEDVFPGDTAVDIDFSSMVAAGSPGERPEGSPVTRIYVAFTLTHPEDAAPVIEAIEFY